MVNRIEYYLTGITNLASSLSKKIGRSYINVNCYEKDKFLDEFSKRYRLKKERIVLEESNDSLNDFLKSCFEDWMLESLNYYFNKDLGNEVKTYYGSKDLISLMEGCNRGLCGFYFLDDLFFVEYDKYMICLLLGNNE